MKGSKILRLLSVILLLVNCYVFLHRDEFNYTKQSAYFDLYPTYNKISVNSFRQINDSTLSIIINNKKPNSTDWIIKTNENVSNLNSKEPIIPLKSGVNDYKIYSSYYKDSLLFKIEYFNNSYFNKLNSNESNRITIFKSILPVENERNQIKKWEQNQIQISEGELKILKSILLNDVGIKATDNSLVKAKKISNFLCFAISKVKGTPSIETKNLSVFQQFQAALNNKKIDCGIYANIFSLFASQSKVVNRIVELTHNYGTFNSNIHVLNEYFIEEQQKWAATDIMLNNIAFVNEGGEYLNAVQIKNIEFLNNSVDVIKSNTLFNSKDSIKKISLPDLETDFNYYYAKDRNLIFYYNTNLKEIYTLKERLNRYFTKNTWSEFYSDVKIIDNSFFYLKQMLIILMIFFFMLSFIFSFLEKKYLKN